IMGMSADIPISRPHELFRYEPEAGDLIWKVRQGRKSAGSVAGSQSKGYPYPYVGLDGRKLIVGRVVFAMHHENGRAASRERATIYAGWCTWETEEGSEGPDAGGGRDE